ncbi:MAG: VCBS repeat-containing protein [Deltaproteobacteria bacterium]|nr:VCBS repeat-containing protein [Deltaproteobacteria bacterium]
MDAGDVDGDGRNEVVILEKDAVHVYKWKAGRFAPFRTLKGGWAPNYVYLSVADVDRNGRAEIYVTNLTASHVSSLAYEWQGRGFTCGGNPRERPGAPGAEANPGRRLQGTGQDPETGRGKTCRGRNPGSPSPGQRVQLRSDAPGKIRGTTHGDAHSL